MCRASYVSPCALPNDMRHPAFIVTHGTFCCNRDAQQWYRPRSFKVQTEFCRNAHPPAHVALSLSLVLHSLRTLSVCRCAEHIFLSFRFASESGSSEVAADPTNRSSPSNFVHRVQLLSALHAFFSRGVLIKSRPCAPNGKAELTPNYPHESLHHGEVAWCKRTKPAELVRPS